MNARFLAAPEHERAWPLYLRAIPLLYTDDWSRVGHPWTVAPTREEAIEWINDHREGIEMVRAAAARAFPDLGRGCANERLRAMCGSLHEFRD